MKKIIFPLLSFVLIFALTACSFVIIPEGGGEKLPPKAPPTEDEKEDMGVWHFGYIVPTPDPSASDGIVNEPAGEYLYSDVIELGAAGTKVSFSDSVGAFDYLEICQLSFWKKEGDGYTRDKEYPIIREGSELIRKEENGCVDYSYVSTLDGECIRFCYRVGKNFDGVFPEIKLEWCDERGTLYDQLKRLEYLEMERERAYYNILEGKRAYFIGDSLFGAHGIGKENSWINLLGEKYRMDYLNLGVNGCTVSSCEGGASPIINRWSKEMPSEAPDIIVFEGGRNDFNKLAKIGSVEERDPATYLGAIALLVEGLRERYPNAIIMAVTFWRTGTVNKEGIPSNDYVLAMMDACEKLGVPYINAYDEQASGVNMMDKEFREKYCFVPGDVCHLNADGMKLALPFFEREIAKIYSENKK